MIRRLRYYDIYCHEKTASINYVTETVKADADMLGYRAIHYKRRQIHGINATRDKVSIVMADADPGGLENRNPICKKKKAKDAFSFVGASWVFSIDGYDKLIVFPNNKFPLHFFL